jgi:hypothetical protein
MFNDENCLLLISSNLPAELIDIIFTYLRPIQLVFLNKFYYNLHHPSIKSYVCNERQQYNSYIRDIVRRDNEIVFSYVLKENLTYWLHMHNYHYKNKTYINFLYYLVDFCCLYDSNKCKELIDNILFDTMSKNQHKKNIVKIVKRKWMN